jgi:hypothetical protein
MREFDSETLLKVPAASVNKMGRRQPELSTQSLSPLHPIFALVR